MLLIPKEGEKCIAHPQRSKQTPYKRGKCAVHPPPTSPPQQKEEKHVASGISHPLATYTIASMAVWLF